MDPSLAYKKFVLFTIEMILFIDVYLLNVVLMDNVLCYFTDVVKVLGCFQARVLLNVE